MYKEGFSEGLDKLFMMESGMAPNRSWSVSNLHVPCQPRHIPSPHTVSVLGLTQIISCFSLWLSSAFSGKTQVHFFYFCSMVVFRSQTLWAFWGYLSCEHNDYPCLMEAKWLKAVSLAEMFEPHGPCACQVETTKVERVTPPKSAAQGGGARLLFKHYEQEGVCVLNVFVFLETELCTWWTLNKYLLMLKETNEEWSAAKRTQTVWAANRNRNTCTVNAEMELDGSGSK